jgi:hypothetical protein
VEDGVGELPVEVDVAVALRTEQAAVRDDAGGEIERDAQRARAGADA